jgi:hypothetical protein
VAGGDDDIERLLKEVESALGPTKPGGDASSGGGRPRPVERSGSSDGQGGDRGAMARVRDGVPVAVTAGAVSGAVVYVVFAIVPFVSSFSGAVGAFIGAAGVSLAGRLRRR